jgi:hypothetical protein
MKIFSHVALILLLLLGGTAMAAPKEPLDYSPLRQVRTPNGTMRDQDSPPTDAEIAQQMWRQHMGDAPMPKRLRDKYGIPDAEKN